MKLDNGELY